MIYSAIISLRVFILTIKRKNVLFERVGSVGFASNLLTPSMTAESKKKPLFLYMKKGWEEEINRLESHNILLTKATTCHHGGGIMTELLTLVLLPRMNIRNLWPMKMFFFFLHKKLAEGFLTNLQIKFLYFFQWR